MQNLLTKYLLQYRKLSIPHVGTLVIVEKPAAIDFIEKRILPPTFETVLKNNGAVSDHQLRYLAAFTKSSADVIHNQLEVLGRSIQEKMNDGAFEWKGIGALTGWGNNLSFPIETLQPVPAEKVRRENPTHNVLVGDHQMLKKDTPTLIENEVPEKKYSFITRIAWGILIVSIAFIAFWIYKNGFSLSATGLQSSP